MPNSATAQARPSLSRFFQTVTARRRSMSGQRRCGGYSAVSLAAVLTAVLLTAVALVLRTLVHWRRTPGGDDTWYFLAYADAVRRKPPFDVRLPQYLLQDERQSYPPLFPMLLALAPGRWLRRWFWIVSPAIDCVHLLFLYFVCYRITSSTAIASLAAAAYA